MHAVVVAYCWRVVAAEGVKDADDKLRMVEPKTRTSRRTVVLPRLAIRHLREHQKRQSATPGTGWEKPGVSTGSCSPPPSARRSSRAISTGAGMNSGSEGASTGSGFMTYGTDARHSCSPQECPHMRLWKCSGTPGSA